MRQAQFEAERQARWDEFEALLQSASKRPRKRSAPAHFEELPSRYRELAHDLALARERRFAPELLERLNGLALRGHHLLYAQRPGAWAQGFEFLWAGFPRLVRSRSQRLWFCLLFFYVPFGLLWLAGSIAPDWVFALLPEAHLEALDDMHGADAAFRSIEADEGFEGFAYYIQNNVGISFRIFAGGILAGIGSLLILGFNGLYLGASFGYIVYAGYTERFVQFVSGHSALELTGIVLSALAGLEIGMAWLLPGRRSRRYALVAGAKDGLLLLAGAATMVTLAAVIEGFWSGRDVAPAAKYTLGIVLWVLVIAYLALGGRRFRTSRARDHATG